MQIEYLMTDRANLEKIKANALKYSKKLKENEEETLELQVERARFSNMKNEFGQEMLVKAQERAQSMLAETSSPSSVGSAQNDEAQRLAIELKKER